MEKILILKVCLKPFGSRICKKLCKSSSSDKIILDIRLKLSVSLMSSINYHSENSSMYNYLDDIVYYIR